MKVTIKNVVKNGEVYRGTVSGISYDFDETATTPGPSWKGRARLYSRSGLLKLGTVQADTLEELIDQAKALV